MLWFTCKRTAEVQHAAVCVLCSVARIQILVTGMHQPDVLYELHKVKHMCTYARRCGSNWSCVFIRKLDGKRIVSNLY
jgi:hypothetical protein